MTFYNPNTGRDLTAGPRIPAGYKHLIVVRLARPEVYPCENHVYDRRDSPGTQMMADWREALVCIMAHEAWHLRQYTVPAAREHGSRGKYNEIDTEWAAYRLLKAWREEQS